jgi:hypothetical protein
MVENCNKIYEASGQQTLCWVYRNGIKALPWHTSVRKLLEDKQQWGLFMPLAGCMPSPGLYVCGPNATQNLYHVRLPSAPRPAFLFSLAREFFLTAFPVPQDFEQTPHGDCGEGVECGE